MSRVCIPTGLLVSVVAAATLAAGQATQIVIDVAPGNSPTVIEAGRGGVLPVVVVSTPAFDPETIDPSTIRFGPTGTEAEPLRTVAEDNDGDGGVDLLVLVRIADVPLPCGETDLRLTAETSAGTAVEGVERVTVTGCAPE